jgi:preprotein translocase subunit SecG
VLARAHILFVSIFFSDFLGAVAPVSKTPCPMGEKHIGHLLPRLTFSLVAVFMHVKLVLTFKNYNYERNE